MTKPHAMTGWQYLAAAGAAGVASVFMTAVGMCAPTLNLSVDERNGLPALSIGGGSVLSSDFVFWRKNWAFAGTDTKFKITAPYQYSITGINTALNFRLNGRVEKTSGQQLRWNIDLDASRRTPDVIGGGISFKFDLDDFRDQLGDPELLPENRGWAWGRPNSARLELRFDPALPTVYFEPGRNKSEIRAMFYWGEVPSGPQHYTATLVLSGDIDVDPTGTEKFGLKDPKAWPTDAIDWQGAPVDLSFLNAAEKPAGKHGFLTAAHGRLVFADGTPARFWGTNLVAYALFATPREAVKLQAHRLAELGFNLVRFHHHDDFVPNIFGDARALDTKNLDITALGKLDWWIKCLEDEGIYIWLDLEDGREFKIADGIEGFDEIAKGKGTADLRGYNYVNASIERAMQVFSDEYLNHRNAFNGLAYKDDPGIAALLLTNENDATFHFGNALLPDKQVPRHDALYMAQAAAFAAQFGLPKDKVWRSWEPGPSKLFLNDLEHRFDAQMIQHLREIGVKVPIVTTSYWAGEPMFSLPALTSGNLMDVHSYGGIDELHKNPLSVATFVDRMAAGHIVDRPLSVTEWNVSPFPTPDRHTSPLFVASSARHQGWDALMQFAYSQQPLTGPGGADNWEAYNDPSLLATLPAAALLYRRGDVQEAKTTYLLALKPEQLFDQDISPDSLAIRTAVEKGKLLVAMPRTKELPWLEESHIPPDAHVITDPNRSLLSSDATYAVSDTGELRHDWGQGTYTIDTPRSQVAMGWVGGKTITLSDATIAVTTPNATVAIQSLDQNGISQSRNILISLGSASVPESGERTPFRSQPIAGEISIRANQGLKLYAQRTPAWRRVLTNPAPVSERSSRLQIPVSYDGGRYHISLGQNMGFHWLILQ